MDSFCTKYTAFFGKLQEFVALLCQRYKTGVPATLRDVPLICTVLQPDDRNPLAAKETIKDKWVINFMALVFDTGGRYVDEEHLEWFKKQSEGLKQMMEELIHSLTKPQGRCISCDVKVIRGGVSDPNPGMTTRQPEAVEKLRKVVEELQ